MQPAAFCRQRLILPEPQRGPPPNRERKSLSSNTSGILQVAAHFVLIGKRIPIHFSALNHWQA